MTSLEITLAWIIIQVTLSLLPAVALHLLASRRGPASGSWTAAASLVMIVAITLLALLPRPRSWTPGRSRDIELAASTATPGAPLAVADQGMLKSALKPAKTGLDVSLWMEQ